MNSLCARSKACSAAASSRVGLCGVAGVGATDRFAVPKDFVAPDLETDVRVGEAFFGADFLAGRGAGLFFTPLAVTGECFFVVACMVRVDDFLTLLLFAADEATVLGFAALRTGAFSAFEFLASGLERAELSVSFRLLVAGADDETRAGREVFRIFLVIDSLIERFLWLLINSNGLKP